MNRRSELFVHGTRGPDPSPPERAPGKDVTACRTTGFAGRRFARCLDRTGRTPRAACARRRAAVRSCRNTTSGSTAGSTNPSTPTSPGGSASRRSAQPEIDPRPKPFLIGGLRCTRGMPDGPRNGADGPSPWPSTAVRKSGNPWSVSSARSSLPMALGTAPPGRGTPWRTTRRNHLRCAWAPARTANGRCSSTKSRLAVRSAHVRSTDRRCDPSGSHPDRSSRPPSPTAA